jgi:hypothetical protein
MQHLKYHRVAQGIKDRPKPYHGARLGLSLPQEKQNKIVQSEFIN